MVTLALPLVLLSTPGASASEAFGDSVYYYGDLHAHTGYSGDAGSSDVGHCISVGACGAVADLATDAQANGLDFLAVTDHVNGFRAMSDAAYLVQNATVLAMDDTANGFVMIPAAELWFYRGNSISDPLGHKTLLMFESNAVLSGLTIDDVRPMYSPHLTSCDEIWDWADTLASSFGSMLLVPHHTATLDPMPTNWSCHDDTYEVATEVYSRHGNSLGETPSWDVPGAGDVSAGYATVAIDPGGYDLSLGFVGGTDSHDTAPGETCARDHMVTSHMYGGGVTVAVLDSSETFDRTAIHDAIVDHRTMASSGPMFAVGISYSVDGVEIAGLGEDFTLYEHDSLDLTVTLPADEAGYVDSVEVIGPTDSWTLDSTDATTWSTTLDAPDAGGYLYVQVNVDGTAFYGSTCFDGGTDANEYIWASPSRITVEDDDLDDDGSLLTDDCDDSDPTVYPGATDTWYDGVDADCAGDSDYDADLDGQDDAAYGGQDCDDDDATVYAGAEDTLYDGVDSNCDESSDYDADLDGFDSTAEGGDDCDDTNADIHPAATDDWYDGIDADCSGDSDYDQDGDGFEVDSEGGSDCDDTRADIYPSAFDDWYDGIDADCAGDSDYDADADGHEYDGEGGDDCDDNDASVHPGVTDDADDGIDADCDGEDPVTATAEADDGGEDLGDIVEAIVDAVIAAAEDTGDTGDTGSGDSAAAVAPDDEDDSAAEIDVANETEAAEAEATETTEASTETEATETEASSADPESDSEETDSASTTASSSSTTLGSHTGMPTGRPPLRPDGTRPPRPPLRSDGSRPPLPRRP